MFTPKQFIGTVMILIVFLCTLLGVAGIWGFVSGDTAWQLFWTLVVCCIGLGTASAMIDRFFNDGKLTQPIVAKVIKKETQTEEQ